MVLIGSDHLISFSSFLELRIREVSFLEAKKTIMGIFINRGKERDLGLFIFFKRTNGNWETKKVQRNLAWGRS